MKTRELCSQIEHARKKKTGYGATIVAVQAALDRNGREDLVYYVVTYECRKCGERWEKKKRV